MGNMLFLFDLGEFLSIFSLLPQGEDKLKFVNRLLNEYYLYISFQRFNLEIPDFVCAYLRFYIGDAEIFRLVSIDLLNHQQYHLA